MQNQKLQSRKQLLIQNQLLNELINFHSKIILIQVVQIRALYQLDNPKNEQITKLFLSHSYRIEFMNLNNQIMNTIWLTWKIQMNLKKEIKKI
ncbi:unnamed protein product [Paramecium sonneborni]|uniref:Uncharacterized protein n=1 Tax=Paramecium sonneborni TaxID=65129 RepID=A0A8S1QLK5_9CILI|nr:unnamed protein product [Paramecium sonneborni]